MFKVKPFKKIVTLLLFLAVVNTLAPEAFAQETRYVADVLYVPLRSGAGNQYRIINAALRSGTELKFLEETEDGSWAKVLTPNEIEGWIPTQYIMSERPSQLQLTEALAKLARVEQDNELLSQKNRQLIEENNSLKNQSAADSSSRENMEKEVQRIREISREALSLKDNNIELLEKNQLLQTERDALIAENEILESDQSTDFMLYGAGLVLLGVILALVVPALIPRKGYSEWK